ncbi:MAG: hypothetical protein RJQ09_13510 [Cyclobacteriaceae bacterium]
MRFNEYFVIAVYIYVMDENKKLKSRMSQIEEVVAATTKNVDKLSADMQEFREYAYENRKVVNGLLNKMDDRQEEIKKLQEETADLRKESQRIAIELEKTGRRLDENIAASRKQWAEQHQINQLLINRLLNE